MQRFCQYLSHGVFIVTICTIALAISFFLYSTPVNSATEDGGIPTSFSPYVSDSGEIARPTQFGTEWTHLGN